MTTMTLAPTRRFAPLSAALTAILSAACPLPINVGDRTSDTADEGESTNGSSTSAPTTSASDPALCGDGHVDDGEACDDGNAEPHDGCDSTCARTGALSWYYESAAGHASGVAIDATGRIVVVGEEAGQALVLALDCSTQ